MTDLRFVLQLAANGVRARARLNGMVVGYIHGTTPAALARSLGPFIIRGKNELSLDGELLERPPDDEPYALELALHAPGGAAPISDVTLLMNYSLTENELPPGNGPHEVLFYTLPLGSDGDGPRAWSQAAEITPQEATAVARAGLAECLRALEGRDPAVLSALVALHAKDHSDQQADVPLEEATFDVLAELIPLLAAPGYKVELATDRLQVDRLLGGKAVLPRTRTGAPPLVVTAGKTTLGIYPTFSMLDGNVRVVRWS